MKSWWWMIVLAALTAGCSLVESSEKKLLREYIAAMNTFCDKVEAAETEAEYRKATEWFAIKVRPMAVKIRRMVEEDPAAMSKAMADKKLARAWQKGVARVAQVTIKATARFGGGSQIKNLMQNMMGPVLYPNADTSEQKRLRDKAMEAMKKLLGKKGSPSTPQPKTKTWRPPPTIIDIPRSGGPVGVASCDTFLKKLRACAEKVPGFKRQELNDLARQWTDTWMTSSRTFAGRRALMSICKRQRKQKAKELGKYGCKF